MWGRAWEGQVGSTGFTSVGLVCSKAHCSNTNCLWQRKQWRRENVNTKHCWSSSDHSTTVGSGRQHCTKSLETMGLHCCICTKITVIVPGYCYEPATATQSAWGTQQCCTPEHRAADRHPWPLSPAVDRLSLPGQTEEFWAWGRLDPTVWVSVRH